MRPSIGISVSQRRRMKFSISYTFDSHGSLLMSAKNAPWLMFFSRITLFLLFQVIFTILSYLLGKIPAWEYSANWWPLTVTLADLVCLFLLIIVFRAEGKNYWHLFRVDRQLFGEICSPYWSSPSWLPRGLMFIPFAFLISFTFHWRPRLLPYFVVIHILMNLSTMIAFLSIAY